MPGVDGLELLADISADPSLDGVRVVMLTTFELDEYVFESLRCGASGFVLKDTDPAGSSMRSASSPTGARCCRRR